MGEDKEFIKGFNQGYLFQKERPVLAKEISSSFKDSEKDFGQGFVAGTKEYEKELVRQHIRDQKAEKGRGRR